MTSRILLVGDHPPPNGGVATHVAELHRAVREQDDAECVVLDIGKGQLPADGVVPAGGIARFAALLASYAARKFQIHVHTSGANPKSWVLAALCAAAGRAAGKPAFITFHSGLGPGWLSQSSSRALVARLVGGQFGQVIAVSDEIQQALTSCGVQGVQVIPAEPAFLRPGTPPVGLPELRREAAPLFCAMVAPGKVYAHDILLEAFAAVLAKHPRARLAVYGPGSESLRAPGVHAFGELHRDAALSLIAASDVFVRPTLADGDSVSVREALALGRSVVATRVGNRPGDVLLVEPGDAIALSLGMLAAAAKPVRAVVPASGESLQRVLQLYGFQSKPAEAAPAARAPEAPCAASAAS